MPITLMTGLPRNCKTLFSIGQVKAWSERESRPVYYYGIPELKLPWIPLKDVTKWHEEVPDGAIIIIDEAQEHFRPAGSSREVPDFIQNLERHGHRGLDFWLITQHPMLVHSNVRKLTQTHKHAVRVWGMEKSTIHTWNAVRENCEKPVARKDSEKLLWRFDKKLYGLYKSSVLHTVKRQIPTKVKLAMCLPFLLAPLVYRAYTSFSERATAAKTEQAAIAKTSGAGSSAVPGASHDSKQFDPIADAKNFVAVSTPRLEGLPHTAPKYDEITKPTVAPVPVACVASAKKCHCYTQQGTRMNVPDQQCRDIAEFGFFQEFDAAGQRQKTDQPVAVLNRDALLPSSSPSAAPPSGNLTDGFGVLGKAGPGVRQPGIEQAASVSSPSKGEQPSPRVPASSPWKAS